MKIKETLKDVLYYDAASDCICRIPNSVLINKSKKDEFCYILTENEEEGVNAWEGYGFADVGNSDKGFGNEYCICSQEITCLYYIQNIKSGNVYQVGCNCIEKHISQEISKYLKKERNTTIKKKKDKEILDIYISKCKVILEWATKHKFFKTDFVSSILDYCNSKNTISQKQKESIDNIIFKFLGNGGMRSHIVL